MRASVRKLKTPIISNKGKRLLLWVTTWKIMEELRRESCIRGYHICKEIWDPAISCKKFCFGEVVQCERVHGKSIFSCHDERRSFWWTFATKDIQTVFTLFATRMHHRKIFVFLIFGFLEVSENIFKPKISGFTVVALMGYSLYGKLTKGLPD